MLQMTPISIKSRTIPSQLKNRACRKEGAQSTPRPRLTVVHSEPTADYVHPAVDSEAYHEDADNGERDTDAEYGRLIGALN